MQEADLRPHRSTYWLNPKIKDPERHAAQLAEICEVYQQAPKLLGEGVHVVSCDEKTGIQALERAAPTRPMRPGLEERREFEYVRHGTLCLTANLEVASGKLVAPTLGPTRSEEDFLHHVQQTVFTDPVGRWIFVVDNLNTHFSASLVRWVGALEGDHDLGDKGTCGVLHNAASRSTYLAEPTHRVRFVYTPKHCSWMNQVEIWFSILVRRALKRASFCSTEQLAAAIRDFIDYFNRLLAKPFRWTYTGRPLTR